MNKAFEIILSWLHKRLDFHENRMAELGGTERDVEDWGSVKAYSDAIDIVEKVAEEYKGCWILCSEKMPPVETEVLICAIRRYKNGSVKNIITVAMYEDGTIRENDSCWNWEDIEGKWDEEEDCYIIPEGWWEDKKYNADCELNHAVDDEVIAWQPLPEPYKEVD